MRACVNQWHAEKDMRLTFLCFSHKLICLLYSWQIMCTQIHIFLHVEYCYKHIQTYSIRSTLTLFLRVCLHVSDGVSMQCKIVLY